MQRSRKTLFIWREKPSIKTDPEMTHDRISWQKHLSSNYACIPYVPEAGGKTEHVNNRCVQFWKDPHRISRDEHYNVKDEKHTVNVKDGCIRISEEKVSEL